MTSHRFFSHRRHEGRHLLSEFSNVLKRGGADEILTSGVVATLSHEQGGSMW